MEDSAIKEGFSCLKNGRDYDPLFASALCRAKADWLIGINATRLFSVLYNHTLNVGRVQTPTLKMLVDRDAAITTFKKEKYYHVRLALSGAEAASERISNKAEADALKTTCEASRAVFMQSLLSVPRVWDTSQQAIFNRRTAGREGENTEKGTLFLCLLRKFFPHWLLQRNALYAKKEQKKNAAICKDYNAS